MPRSEGRDVERLIYAALLRGAEEEAGAQGRRAPVTRDAVAARRDQLRRVVSIARRRLQWLEVLDGVLAALGEAGWREAAPPTPCTSCGRRSFGLDQISAMATRAKFNRLPVRCPAGHVLHLGCVHFGS